MGLTPPSPTTPLPDSPERDFRVHDLITSAMHDGPTHLRPSRGLPPILRRRVPLCSSIPAGKIFRASPTSESATWCRTLASAETAMTTDWGASKYTQPCKSRTEGRRRSRMLSGGGCRRIQQSWRGKAVPPGTRIFSTSPSWFSRFCPAPSSWSGKGTRKTADVRRERAVCPPRVR